MEAIKVPVPLEEGAYRLTEFDDEVVHLKKKVVNGEVYLFEPKQTEVDPSIVGLCYRFVEVSNTWEYAQIDKDDIFVGDWTQTNLSKINS